MKKQSELDDSSIKGVKKGGGGHLKSNFFLQKRGEGGGREREIVNRSEGKL